jgi:DNA-binding NarL/FixJ family response regulator
LQALLEKTNGISIVGDAGTAVELPGIVEDQHPDVVLLAMDGWGEREVRLLEALPWLSERTRTLVVTSDVDPNLHARAIQLGAMGIVLKTQPARSLVKAVQKVHAGELWLDRAQTADLVNRLTHKRTDEDPQAARIGSLTAREREIVTLVTEGLKNKDIADRLSISEATARNHLTSILDKLALSNRFELAVYAFRKGLVPCPQTPAILRSTGASREDIYPRPHPGGSSSIGVARQSVAAGTSGDCEPQWITTLR